MNEDELLIAAKTGNVVAAKALLEAGASPNAKDDGDQTALSHAARRGHTELVDLLLIAGADPQATGGINGYSPLHWASIHGHMRSIDLLLAAGADPNATDYSNRTPFVEASLSGQGIAAVRLLASGARLDEVKFKRSEINFLLDPEFCQKLIDICKLGGLDAEQIGGIPPIGSSEWRGMAANEWCALAELYLKSHAITGLPEACPPILGSLLHGKDSFRDRSSKLTNINIDKCRVASNIFKEFNSYVLLPALLLRCGLEDDDERLKTIATDKILDALLPIAVNLIADGRNLETMLRFSESWHQPHHNFPSDQLRPLAARNEEWYPLIIAKEVIVPPDQLAAGWRIRPLTCTKELIDEGIALSHCIGSSNYSEKCLSNIKFERSHILSIFDNFGSKVSTVELGDALDVRQHRGKLNHAPPEPANAALNWFIEQLHEGVIPLNDHRGETHTSRERSRVASIAPVLQTIGFRPNAESIDAALEHYQKIVTIKQNRNNGKGFYIEPLINGCVFIGDGNTRKLAGHTEYQSGETKFFSTMGIAEFLETSGIGFKLDSLSEDLGLTHKVSCSKISRSFF